ncbi:MAG: helix-turn-helix transcriptional regulator [Lachnospiraceae bacterium]|nr:helix-turn-helix transcriptional regulator [Lachnospiraceae bacterium]MBQ2404509.1 helix-turn-helix transcriptional regulator [Lachnospiraceae bacterium]MBQ2426476.1 helix-turn-helix transcriptional regulator [Lachnospiraceae bacterium]MBQ5598956.1 helix-turn-helix transcriptional regulator [Lachnospiraceae bacterium]MBQ5698377.1 helix-turn-helix transcriptional regulator [Lachnospiraceae bacterium]
MYRISKVETGRRLRKLMNWHGVTVREVQEEMELESPQAIYKWLNGRALPSLENLLILGRLLNVSMEDMLVAEQTSVGKERKKLWDEKHPPAFMSYKMQVREPAREVDERRFIQYLDFFDQDRMRAAYSYQA